jgi:hypothetical protein
MEGVVRFTIGQRDRSSTPFAGRHVEPVHAFRLVATDARTECGSRLLDGILPSI